MVLTWPPCFIRIQFKTFILVCIISSFYKAFVQFSSHSIELFSRRKSLLYFFPGAFNIKLVNSFILVWHSDYELSSKTQKPFFILQESRKCHNIKYQVKNGWLPVKQRIIFKISLICFKILNNLAPGYLVDLLQVYGPARCLRSSSDKWCLA